MMRRFFILSILFVAGVISSFAQADRQYINEGNREYHRQKFDKAEVLYRKALEKNPNNPQAIYNLGCALMMQQKDSAAIEQYQKAAKIETSKHRLSMVYHNIGVISQNNKMYDQAIEAYKQSLRNNPSDDETRYNLALCQRLKKDEDQNSQNNQSSSNDKDNKNNKDKQNDKDNKDGKDNQDKDKDKNEQPPQQNQDGGMSRENAEQMLNAAIQEEKNTQDKMRRAMQRQGSRQLEKNW